MAPSDKQEIFLVRLPALKAQELADRLEDAGLSFRVEMDDGAIRELSPVSAKYGGTFGLGAEILFFVHSGNLSKAKQILEALGL